MSKPPVDIAPWRVWCGTFRGFGAGIAISYQANSPDVAFRETPERARALAAAILEAVDFNNPDLLAKKGTGVTLKPCPFCGGEAEFERRGTTRVSCIVVCTECGARHESADSDVWSGTAWNRRTY